MHSNFFKAKPVSTRNAKITDYSDLHLQEAFKFNPVMKENFMFVENTLNKLDNLISNSAKVEEINKEEMGTLNGLKRDQTEYFTGIEKNFHNLYEQDHYKGALDQQDVLDELNVNRKKSEKIVKNNFKRNSDKRSKVFLGAEFYSNLNKPKNTRKYFPTTINIGH